MKVERLLGIIVLLLKKDKIKAKELAEKFEVSIRTIHRDIEQISIAGIPIVTYQGGDGGIGIAEGYKLDKSLLTHEEMDNIVIGLRSLDSFSKDKKVKMLLDKFSPGKEDVLSVGKDIFIDLTSFYKISLSEKIGVLRESINNNTEVFLKYYSTNGISERNLEPYFITFRWSAWYVFGYCKLREEFRLFKLNRIEKLQVTEQKFVPRDIPEEKIKFDDYFNEGDTVTMLIDRCLEYQIVEEYGVGSYEITADNFIKFELVYKNYDFALKFVMGMGDKAKVIAPPFFIEDLRLKLENILNKYK